MISMCETKIYSKIWRNELKYWLSKLTIFNNICSVTIGKTWFFIYIFFHGLRAEIFFDRILGNHVYLKKVLNNHPCSLPMKKDIYKKPCFSYCNTANVIKNYQFWHPIFQLVSSNFTVNLGFTHWNHLNFTNIG